MPEKPNIAFYWCASCGGCEESVVDLAENILDILEAVNIVFWPVAMDFKKADVQALPNGSILASLINGAIRTSEQEEMARLLRAKSRLVIAYGSCAHLGGIPSLSNQTDREELLRYVYQEAPTVQNENGIRPSTVHTVDGMSVVLPEFRETVRALDQVVGVDYYLPGCPPTPKLLRQAIEVLLSGNLPPARSVLAPDHALCEECPRKDTKPSDLRPSAFRRPHLTKTDRELCLLAQGLICMGPATRGGCEAQCIRGNMACSGCFGPPANVADQGAKMLTALVSSLSPSDEEGIAQALATIPDPVGTFYRYGLARSLLRGKVPPASPGEGMSSPR
jgi:F420-non-reducing hydrogenase small subunit